MNSIRLCPSHLSDYTSFYTSIANAGLDVHLHPLTYAEERLLRGKFADARYFFDDQLSDLRAFVNNLAEPYDDIVIDLGYELTSLFAAYYAVLASPNVTVNLLTLPAFGGDTPYARTHPFLIRKLLYNVLAKAKRLTAPVANGKEWLQEAYPRFDREIEHVPVRLSEVFVAESSDVMRDGLAIFAEFEPNGGIDRCLDACNKALRFRPHLRQCPVRVLGRGNIEQSAAIAKAFEEPHGWEVVFNPPPEVYRRAALESEVVILPDTPPHAGPTAELFTAIGAGAAIVAHEHSAAFEYAGKGAILFGDADPLGLMRAIVTATDPSKTIELMAATYARREELRNPILPPVDARDLVS